MKVAIFLVCVMMFWPISTVRADFKIDLDTNEINEILEVYTVGDLGVGDSGYVNTYASFCNDDGYLMFPKNIALENDRIAHYSYFKVKRLPSDKISIELIPSGTDELNLLEPGTKKDVIVEFLKTFGKIRSVLTCQVYHSFLGYSENDLMRVDSVENADSLATLIKLISP